VLDVTTASLVDQGGNNVVMQQFNNGPNSEAESGDGALTLQQIAERLEVKYGRLRGFAEAEGVRGHVGAIDAKGVKGVRYPAEAVALFRNLIEAQDAGLVTPKTASAWLSRLRAETGDAAMLPSDTSAMSPHTRPTGSAIVPMSQSDNGPLLSLLDRLVRAQESQPAPPAEDRLLDADAAAELLACSPRSVGRYVRPVRRGVWRRSDIMHYIAALRPLARDGRGEA